MVFIDFKRSAWALGLSLIVSPALVFASSGNQCSAKNLGARRNAVKQLASSCTGAQRKVTSLKKAHAAASKIKGAKKASAKACSASSVAKGKLDELIAFCSAPKMPSLPAPTVENAARKQQLLDALLAYDYKLWVPQIVQKALTYKISNSCWDKMLSTGGASYSDGVFISTSVAYNVEKYAIQRGWSPAATLENIETANNEDRPSQLPLISSYVDSLATHFSYTLNLEEIGCSDAQYNRVHNYFSVLISNYALYNFAPLNGNTKITLIVTPRVSDIFVGTNTEKTEIYVFAPSELEPEAWGDKMYNGIVAITGL